jgi:hypothetical protein
MLAVGKNNFSVGAKKGSSCKQRTCTLKKTFKESTDYPSVITNLVSSSDLEYGHHSDVLPADINFQETAKSASRLDNPIITTILHQSTLLSDSC